MIDRFIDLDGSERTYQKSVSACQDAALLYRSPQSPHSAPSEILRRRRVDVNLFVVLTATNLSYSKGFRAEARARTANNSTNRMAVFEANPVFEAKPLFWRGGSTL